MEYQSVIEKAIAETARGIEALQFAQHPTVAAEKKTLFPAPELDEVFKQEMLEAARSELVVSTLFQLTNPLDDINTSCQNEVRWSWLDPNIFQAAEIFARNIISALDRLGASSFAIVSPTALTFLQAGKGDMFDSIYNEELLADGKPYTAFGMSAVLRNKGHIVLLNAYASDITPVYCIGENAFQYSAKDYFGLQDGSFWTDVVFTFDESAVALVNIELSSLLEL